MSVSAGHFVSLLKVELQDVIEDIESLERQLRERFESAQITPYVYRENDVVLHREHAAINNFLSYIDGIDIAVYKDMAEISAALLGQLHTQLAATGGPGAVLSLVRRKINKLEEYLHAGDA